MLRVDYKKFSRFKMASNEEHYQDMVKCVIDITALMNSFNFFYEEKVVSMTRLQNNRRIDEIETQFLPDERIIALLKLFKEKEFLQKDSCQQYQSIKTIVMQPKPVSVLSFFLLPKKATEADELIKMIMEEKKQELEWTRMKILYWLDSISSGYFAKHAPLYASRSMLKFEKEMILAVATWWADYLQYASSPEQQQRTILLTTIADNIWQSCQLLEKNVSDYSPIHLVHSSTIIQSALKLARVKIEKVKQEKLRMEMFVCHSFATVEVGKHQFLRRVKEINAKLTSLPSDEMIRYRDTLSTLWRGLPEDNTKTNLYSLPSGLLTDICEKSRPEGMTRNTARKEIFTNIKRLEHRMAFFKQEEKCPLLGENSESQKSQLISTI